MNTDQKIIDKVVECVKNDKHSVNEVFMSIADQLVKERDAPEETSLKIKPFDFVSPQQKYRLLL